MLKRFLDEARAFALEHRNLSHVYDVNQGGDQYYIVMEYVEGQNLQSLVEKAGKLPIAEALDYVRQTAEGLAHAHEHGVVHGDLKPSNLVLDVSRTVKILDIGQARLAESPATPSEKDETTETASLAAAIHHAPEQRGQVRDDRPAERYLFAGKRAVLFAHRHCGSRCRGRGEATAAGFQIADVARQALPEDDGGPTGGTAGIHAGPC